jgi:hypothetical protein
VHSDGAIWIVSASGRRRLTQEQLQFQLQWLEMPTERL